MEFTQPFKVHPTGLSREVPLGNFVFGRTYLVSHHVRMDQNGVRSLMVCDYFGGTPLSGSWTNFLGSTAELEFDNDPYQLLTSAVDERKRYIEFSVRTSTQTQFTHYPQHCAHQGHRIVQLDKVFHHERVLELCYGNNFATGQRYIFHFGRVRTFSCFLSSKSLFSVCDIMLVKRYTNVFSQL